jgi:hypothetical protein
MRHSFRGRDQSGGLVWEVTIATSIVPSEQRKAYVVAAAVLCESAAMTKSEPVSPPLCHRHQPRPTGHHWSLAHHVDLVDLIVGFQRELPAAARNGVQNCAPTSAAVLAGPTGTGCGLIAWGGGGMLRPSTSGSDKHLCLSRH